MFFIYPDAKCGGSGPGCAVARAKEVANAQVDNPGRKDRGKGLVDRRKWIESFN